MAALLAFMSSIVWGTGDFFGGKMSRHRSAFAVTLGMQVFGLVFVVGWALLTGVWEDRKSTRLNSSHIPLSRMPSSA